MCCKYFFHILYFRCYTIKPNMTLQIDEDFLPMQLSPNCIKQEVDEFTIKQEIETDASMRQRLFESLSSSFPGSALSRALAAMDDDELDSDPLSRSCFAELRLEKGRMEDEDDEDDELTSLSWLQDTDLLKNLSPACPSPTDDVKENTLNGGTYGQTHPPHVPYNPLKHVNSKPPYSFSCLIFMAIEDSPIKKLPVKDIYNWILTHFPYFRNAPTGWKNSVRHNLSLNKCFKKVEKEKGQVRSNFKPNMSAIV
jgi:forkhead box protein N